MAKEDFLKTFAAFPGRYPLFAVMANGKICAAAISILVTGDILSNFLVNQEGVYNKLSPSVLLMEGIYDYCRRHDVTLFDLGTSALNGEPNFSLLDFKLHLGAIPVSKLSFHKQIV
jgi:hypothetical protein